jgi:hypothetical protein
MGVGEGADGGPVGLGGGVDVEQGRRRRRGRGRGLRQVGGEARILQVVVGVGPSKMFRDFACPGAGGCYVHGHMVKGRFISVNPQKGAGRLGGPGDGRGGVRHVQPVSAGDGSRRRWRRCGRGRRRTTRRPFGKRTTRAIRRCCSRWRWGGRRSWRAISRRRARRSRRRSRRRGTRTSRRWCRLRGRRRRGGGAGERQGDPVPGAELRADAGAPLPGAELSGDERRDRRGGRGAPGEPRAGGARKRRDREGNRAGKSKNPDGTRRRRRRAIRSWGRSMRGSTSWPVR